MWTFFKDSIKVLYLRVHLKTIEFVIYVLELKEYDTISFFLSKIIYLFIWAVNLLSQVKWQKTKSPKLTS